MSGESFEELLNEVSNLSDNSMDDKMTEKSSKQGSIDFKIPKNVSGVPPQNIGKHKMTKFVSEAGSSGSNSAPPSKTSTDILTKTPKNISTPSQTPANTSRSRRTTANVKSCSGGSDSSKSDKRKKNTKPYSSKAENKYYRQRMKEITEEMKMLSTEYGDIPPTPPVQTTDAALKAGAQNNPPPTPHVQNTATALPDGAEKDHPPPPPEQTAATTVKAGGQSSQNKSKIKVGAEQNTIPVQKTRTNDAPFLNQGPAKTSLLITSQGFTEKNQELMEKAFNIRDGPDLIGKAAANSPDDLFIVKMIKEEDLETEKIRVQGIPFKGHQVKAKKFKQKYPYRVNRVTLYSDTWKKKGGNA